MALHTTEVLDSLWFVLNVAPTSFIWWPFALVLEDAVNSPSLLSSWGYVQLFRLLSHPFPLPDWRVTACSVFNRNTVPPASLCVWNLTFWLWWMADDWALYWIRGCCKGGGWIQVSSILLCVSTPSNLFLELVKYLLFFPLTSSQGLLLTGSPAQKLNILFLLCSYFVLV